MKEPTPGRAELAVTALVIGLGLTLAVAGVLHGVSGGSDESRLKDYWDIPPFQMTAVTTAGVSTLGRDDLLGAPWVGAVIFTSCQAQCPMISERLAGLQSAVAAPVRFLSFTVDPENDDEKALKAYAARFGADPARWLHMRAPRAETFVFLADGLKLGVVEDPKAPLGLRYSHSSRLVLVDARGRARGYYDSNDPAAMRALRRDIRILNEEKQT